MGRKRARLDALDGIEMRVTWQDVERNEREGGTTFETFDRPPARARLIAAVTAFAVFIPIAVFGWFALRDSGGSVVGVPETPEVVLTLTETGPDELPSATLSIDGRTQVGHPGGGSWNDERFVADRFELVEFLTIPQGAELVVASTTASVLAVRLADPNDPFEPLPRGIYDLSAGRATLDAAPGRYGLVVPTEWPQGRVPFYFGIEIVAADEPEVFFPTWEMDARPEAVVSGTLVLRDGCLFAASGDGASLILWERGLAYRGGTVVDGGRVLAQVGEPFEGAGGYYSRSDLGFVEELIGEPVPQRCLPATEADGFVLAYDIGPAPAGETPPVDPTPAIVVTSPMPGDVVSTPVTIEGTANVFEGTVRIRMVDAINNRIVDTFTTATCGSGCEGTFSASVEFSVAEEQQGEIIVFEEDAETGKPRNTVRIPVTLLPGPTVEAARGFIGEWTDADGQPVGEDRVSSTLGPEHCSWGDIVFLRYAGGEGVAPLTYVRDTTGELAGYTLGEWTVLGEPDAGLVDTGLRVNGRELWVDPGDAGFVILWDPAAGVTERWPALREEVACA
jgi:hypothetical protein